MSYGADRSPDRMKLAAAVAVAVACWGCGDAVGPGVSPPGSGDGGDSRQVNGTGGTPVVFSQPEPNCPFEGLGGPLEHSDDSDIGNVALSLDPRNDQPVVSWTEGTSNPFAVTLYVRRWTGSSWDPLGDGQVVGERAYHAALAVGPSGELFVARTLEDGRPFGLAVHRFDEASQTWQKLDAPLVVDPTRDVSLPRLVVGGDGEPIVAWVETSLDPASASLEVARWTGSSWQAAGQFKQSVDSIPYLKLAREPGSGVLVLSENVSLQPYPVTWTNAGGQSWTQLPEFKGGSNVEQLAVSPGPTVFLLGYQQVYDPIAGILDAGVTSWTLLPATHLVHNWTEPETLGLAVAPRGTAPFVSGGPTALTVQFWDGTAWADRCRSDQFPVSTVLAVGHDERPVVALFDNLVYSEKLLVIRLK